MVRNLKKLREITNVYTNHSKSFMPRKVIRLYLSEETVN